MYQGASLVTQIVKNLPVMRETWVQSLGQEDPLEKGMIPTPVFLPGEFHGQRMMIRFPMAEWQWVSTAAERRRKA